MVVVAVVILGIVLVRDYYRDKEVFVLPNTDVLSQTEDGLTIFLLGISEEYLSSEYASQMVDLHTFPHTSGVRIWTAVEAPEGMIPGPAVLSWKPLMVRS